MERSRACSCARAVRAGARTCKRAEFARADVVEDAAEEIGGEAEEREGGGILDEWRQELIVERVRLDLVDGGHVPAHRREALHEERGCVIC